MAASSDNGSDGRGAALGAILLLALTLSMNACSTTAPADIPTADAQQAAKTAESATLSVMIDWSGSCVHTALEEAWKTVKTELPKIVETYHVTDLSISSFDEDGWSPTRLKELPLPVLNFPARQKENPTEWDSFRNIRDAVREAEEGKRRKEMSQAEGAYERALREALAALDSETIIPEPQRQSKRTDIVGLFKRIAQTHNEGPQYIIILTDLADTQYRQLPQIPAPTSEVHVLVLLIPAQRQDALLTTGKPLSGQEQYELRSRQLRESAPWVGVAPYFVKHLSSEKLWKLRRPAEFLAMPFSGEPLPKLLR